MLDEKMLGDEPEGATRMWSASGCRSMRRAFAMAAVVVVGIVLFASCSGVRKGAPKVMGLENSLLLGEQTSALDQIGTIYIIRHGERDGVDVGGPVAPACLNRSGWHRAEMLPKIFAGVQLKGLFAYNYQRPWRMVCQRCLQTIAPLAMKVKLEVNHDHPAQGESCFHYISPHHDCGNKKAAEAMKEALDRTHGGPILVVWESANIRTLLTELGVSNAPSWPWSNCARAYDQILQVNFTKTDTPKHSLRLMTAQNLSMQGSWKLHAWTTRAQGLPCLASSIGSRRELSGASWSPRAP